jgi:protein TonB
MFDLIMGNAKHLPRAGARSVVVSTVLHVGILGTLVIVPLLYVSHALPSVPTMMAFVAAAPAPPPPPPPPPPKVAPEKTPAKAATASPNAAPVEAPTRIEPEPVGTTARGGDEGVPGGVEGGIPGGVVGGFVGGIPDAPPPPPPPPPPAAPRGPVRVGGQIQPPALLKRVEAVYPELAVRAHVEGTVILEAVVDESGKVQSVKVLRSIPLLDNAAIAAVEQWRYQPVILNGTPVPFVLTVVMSFNIPENRTSRY